MGQKHRKKHRHPGPDPRLAQSALDRGLNALASGDLASALRELSTAWRGLKSDRARDALVDAVRRAAPELVSSPDERAVELLDQAVELAPADTALRRQLAMACWSAGDLDAASRALDPLANDAARGPSVRLALALVRAEQGLPDVARKLAGCGSAAEPSPAGAPRDADARRLVELALALQARETQVLADLANARPGEKECDAILYSVSSRCDNAARWFLTEAKAALGETLASGRTAAALTLRHACSIPDRVPVPDARAVLAPLVDALEARLAEASTVRVATTGTPWTAAAARALSALERGEAARPDLPADAPAELRTTLEIACTAARGDSTAALDELIERADKLPAAAARTLAEAIVTALPASDLTKERSAALEARWPALAHELRARQAAEALAALDPRAALAHAGHLRELGPDGWLAEALALELDGRAEEAAPRWTALLEEALRRDDTPSPPWFRLALHRSIDHGPTDPRVERLLRRALARDPGDFEARVRLGEHLARTPGRGALESAREVLEAARPATSAQAFRMARVLALCLETRRALDLLATIPADERPPSFGSLVDRVLTLASFQAPFRERLSVLESLDRLHPPGALSLAQRAEVLEDMGREREAHARRREAAAALDPADDRAVKLALELLDDDDPPEALEFLSRLDPTRLAALPVDDGSAAIAELLGSAHVHAGWKLLDARLSACEDSVAQYEFLLLVFDQVMGLHSSRPCADVLDQLAGRMQASGRLGAELERALEMVKRESFGPSGDDDELPDETFLEAAGLLEDAADRVRRRIQPKGWCEHCGRVHREDRHEEQVGVDVLEAPEPFALPHAELEALAAETGTRLARRTAVHDLPHHVRRAVVSVAARAAGLEA